MCFLSFLEKQKKPLSTKQRRDRRDDWLWQPSMFVLLLLLLEWILQCTFLSGRVHHCVRLLRLRGFWILVRGVCVGSGLWAVGIGILS
jgi:hypothetical protein